MNGGYLYHPSWPVFLEDNHLLALYKPAGLLVQADQTGEVSLLELGKSWLKERYSKPGRVFLGMVHRLDRPVAGIVLFCRTSKAAARLSEQFRTGTVRKRYLAVVEGRMEPESGRLTHHIERREKVSSRIVPPSTPNSREARLTYRVLEAAGDRSLVEVHLETGRHHQIRLQMSHVGHPVLGDLRYGASRPLPQKQVALFAVELAVDHPVRSERIVLRSPLPQGWPWPPGPSNNHPPPWNWADLSTLVSPNEPDH
jgi:23S rRNA pseudouridine1911/1915/1917 synthase